MLWKGLTATHALGKIVQLPNTDGGIAGALEVDGARARFVASVGRGPVVVVHDQTARGLVARPGSGFVVPDTSHDIMTK